MQKTILRTIPLITLVFVAFLVTGCATTGDVERLEQAISKAQSTADDAKAAAAAAQRTANEAKNAASTAQHTANDARVEAAGARAATDALDQKVDRMFEKVMRK